ncbi:LURP-one-related/scramblase family protein [Planctomicrobium sp. SH664]|uniref:LURP-one-related/scramblase family protein n=1 Tax=Planctomicrobium sp. SH664 TaxID=3448125 RepID=UPI003F5CB81A
MHPVLNQNLFFVKEHVGFFKAANNYDVFDPSTGEEILHCREPNLGTITKLLRFTDYKRMTPFDIYLTTPEGEPVLRVHRGVNFFLSKVLVSDEDDVVVGGFKQKLFSIGGAFQVLSANDEPLCQLQGKWTGWEFKFVHEGDVLATVSRKWSGIGKELFTDADNYVLSISDSVPPDNPLRILIVGAVFCIDMVLKEK